MMMLKGCCAYLVVRVQVHNRSQQTFE